MQQSHNNKNEALIQLKVSYIENERTVFSIVVTGKNEANLMHTDLDKCH